MLRLGDLPDLEPEETFVESETLLKAKRSSRKPNITPVDVRKEEDASLKPETPGSGAGISPEIFAILEMFDALTGDSHRDKCLGKLLEAVQPICCTHENKKTGDEAKVGSDGSSLEQDEKTAKPENGSEEKDETFLWPDAAVTPVCALEKASHASLFSDYHKYNQKMRTLVFNLKNTALLARRLLNGELEPEKILNMSPSELKEGLTAEETEKEPDEVPQMQMTDAKCSRCSLQTVGLRDIIQAGHGDRYQLECLKCGCSWYASRDEASTMTIEPAKTRKAAQVTENEDTEKNVTSPREAEKPTEEEALKTNDSNADNNPEEATKKPE